MPSIGCIAREASQEKEGKERITSAILLSCLCCDTFLFCFKRIQITASATSSLQLVQVMFSQPICGQGGAISREVPVTQLVSLGHMSSNLNEDLMLSLEQFNHLRGSNAMLLMTQSMRYPTHL
jgi:hypothetical protein